MAGAPAGEHLGARPSGTLARHPQRLRGRPWRVSPGVYHLSRHSIRRQRWQLRTIFFHALKPRDDFTLRPRNATFRYGDASWKCALLLLTKQRRVAQASYLHDLFLGQHDIQLRFAHALPRLLALATLAPSITFRHMPCRTLRFGSAFSIRSNVPSSTALKNDIRIAELLGILPQETPRIPKANLISTQSRTRRQLISIFPICGGRNGLMAAYSESSIL
jgi:hypothetical protein